jgi:signal transduction histidine kinase
MAIEKRELRVHLDRGVTPVACDLRGSEPRAGGTFRLANISRSGMFLESTGDMAVAQGHAVQFSMRLDQERDEVSGVARVRWVRPREQGPYLPRGLGVQVVEFNENAEKRYLDFLENCLVNLKITDLMDPGYADVAPGASVRSVVQLLRAKGVDCAVVVDTHSSPIGIFTRSDLVRILDGDGALDEPVSAHMTMNPTTVSTEQSTDDAYNMMRFGSLHHLPVLEDGIVVGVLSTRDLVRYWAEFMDLQSKRLSRSYDRAMSVIAHDLRTPLGVIRTTNLMLTSGALEPREYLAAGLGESIDGTCEMMLGLIDDILDDGSIASGNIRLNRVPLDLREFLTKVHRWFEPSAKAKGIHLALGVVDDELPLVAADPLRLEQVMSNLVGNALKYTPERGRVTIGAETRHSRVAIWVRDNGPGIAEKEQSKLFREFTPLSSVPAKGEKSTGLGLAIAKRLVEAHGGAIEVDSRLGSGTTFRVLLPLGDIQ